MPPALYVHPLPGAVAPEDLAGGTVVVIDVLRASTTIAHALECGAAEVVPCREVDEARRLAREIPSVDVLLGGERGGLPIEGFDLGNSPAEYTPDRIAGKTIVFTTTNGTQAMVHARAAERILIGAFVNASAVVRELRDRQQIHLLCAGTRGQLSTDDLLLAGMLAERINRQGGGTHRENAQAAAARETWLGTFALPQALGAEPIAPERLAAELQTSLGGRNLVAIHLEADILDAARIDRFHRVPRFDPQRSRIRLI